MQVQSTMTILDKQKEQKELMLEINKLKAEKEILRREVGEYSEAKSALMKEVISGVTVGDLKETTLSNIRNSYKDEIQGLSVKKESLENSLLNKGTEHKNIKEKYKKILKNIEESSIVLESIDLELERVKIEKKEEIRLLEEIISNNLDKKNKANLELESLLKEISDKKKEFEDRQAFLLKEEIRLANKGSDLAIYEARLRKKYLELMPEFEIVV